MTTVLGLDIGGTSLKLGAWCGDERLAWRDGIAVPMSSDGSEVAGCVAREVQSFADGLSATPQALGVGSCGLIRGGVIYQSPNTPWDELPLEQLLEARLGYPVHLLNDADAFLLGALGDWAPGAMAALGITLGTGLGTAVWLGGRLLLGGAGISPEGGHITIDYDGEIANTGIPGTWESLACRAALLSYYAGEGGRADDPLQVADAAARGEASALRAWARYGGCLGAGLGSLCNVFSPEVVLIGGGMAGAHQFFEEALAEAVNRHMLRALPRPCLTFLPQLPEAVARGAAKYAALMVDHV